jgi:16S rRNA (cytosine967-C5)-methyltransferase
MSPARRTAFQILSLVERGGYATDLLASRTRGMDARDAGLAAQIVYGCLRRRAQLDFLIADLAGRPAAALDVEVLLALRMGLFQLLYLDRIPPHAAVSESVELVRRAKKASAAGFVNAVLRKAKRQPVSWPDEATELSAPAWLLDRWRGRYGAPATRAIALAFLEEPETYVRLCSGVPPPGVEVVLTAVPGCFRVKSGGVDGLPVQDIGSQAVVPLLDLKPGLSFLDLCAAPGNKTAQAMECGVQAVACDLHLSRARRLASLGCNVVVLDGTRPLPFRAAFDRILVDAPCSGPGTLGRNPEIKWKLKPEDLAALQERQVRLLANALAALAPGGRLVYSTCSLEREENEDVLERVLGRVPQTVWRRLPGRDPGDGFFAAVIGSV